MRKNPQPTCHKALCFQLRPFSFLLVPFLFLMTMCSGVPILDLNSAKASQLDAMVKGACGGRIRDCPTESLEGQMDSETNKRMLLMQNQRYISYDTLKRDFAPCGTPGSSYYNCKAGPVNRYNRGCEIITRCARGN